MIVLKIAFILIVIKSVTIGSEFNFFKFVKNPKQYWKDYNDWCDKMP